MRMWAVLCVKPTTDAADVKARSSRELFFQASAGRHLAIMKFNAPLMEEVVGVSTTEAGLLTFTGGARIVVLLSNHTESSCVRCITAARYATYGMEKLLIQVELTIGVTDCVQSPGAMTGTARNMRDDMI